jgi:hypothetical protein
MWRLGVLKRNRREVVLEGFPFMGCSQVRGGERGQERLSVLFENDQLVSLSGDFEPTPEAEC